MKITVTGKHLAVFFILLVVAVAGYLTKDRMKEVSSLFSNDAEKTVNLALKYLKAEDLQNSIKHLSTDYSLNLLGNYPYYKIETWSLKSEKVTKEKYMIQVNGATTNAFGAKLQRNPIFVVEKQNQKWEITDSYGFVTSSKLDDIEGSTKTDMEKHKLLEETKEKVIIEDWSFYSSYSSSVEGKATIYNGSQVPVKFVKILITYRNKAGEVVNSDDTYAISSEPLRPGQRKNITWYTSDCYNCYKASVKLDFN
ncbi:MAG: hypothetical protein DKINENOH_01000 [bacterium]|nr:hypothetical protein [bacterium]